MDTKLKRGQTLRDLRLKRHLTQKEAAENFSISQQTYQKYESGKVEPPYDLLCDFADFYGVTTDYLLGREEAPEPLEQLASQTYMEVTEQVLLEKYLELPKASREIVINFMKSAIAEAEARAKQTEQAEEKQTKPNIKLNQGLAVARTSDPDKLYRPAPTEEQMKQFDLVTPDMLGEDE